MSEKTRFDGSPIKNSDLDRFDYLTVFYDVFFTPDNEFLIALGPPLLNLRDALLPITISLNGIPLRMREDNHYKALTIIKCRIEQPKTVLPSNSVQIAFATSYSIQLQVPGRCDAISSGKALVTLQKDNKPEWIGEWMLYYKRRFSIERIFIYDNGSAYQERLSDLCGDDVNYVYWNFPYGSIAVFAHEYCQKGALNHWALKFGGKSIAFSFDIDELLIADSEKLDILMRRKAAIVFDSFDVPCSPVRAETISYRDCVMRERSSRGRSFKFVWRPSMCRYIEQHSVVVHPRLGRFLHLWRRLIEKICYFCDQDNTFQFLCHLKQFLQNASDYVSRVIRAKPNNMYFLHCLSITTNWKLDYADRFSHIRDLRELIKDGGALPYLRER